MICDFRLIANTHSFSFSGSLYLKEECSLKFVYDEQQMQDLSALVLIYDKMNSYLRHNPNNLFLKCKNRYCEKIGVDESFKNKNGDYRFFNHSLYAYPRKEKPLLLSGLNVMRILFEDSDYTASCATEIKLVFMYYSLRELHCS